MGLILEQLGSVQNCGCKCNDCDGKNKDMRILNTVRRRVFRPVRSKAIRKLSLNNNRPKTPAVKRFSIRTTAPKLKLRPTAQTKPIRAAAPVVRRSIKPVVRPVIKRVVNAIKRPVFKPVVRPAVKPVIKPVIKTVQRTAAPVVRRSIKPAVKPVIKPVIKTVQRTAAPVVRRSIKPAVKPVIKPVVKTVQRTAAPVVRHSIKPVVKAQEPVKRTQAIQPPPPPIQQPKPTQPAADVVQMPVADSSEFKEAVKDRESKKSSSGFWAAILPAAAAIAIKKIF